MTASGLMKYEDPLKYTVHVKWFMLSDTAQVKWPVHIISSMLA